MPLGAGAVEPHDQASYEAFISELIASGFEPVPGRTRREWRGPVHPAFRAFTESREMVIRLSDGWPFAPPAVLVSGISAEHVDASGQVCLWQPDEPSREWMTLEGVGARIKEWCRRASTGWRPEDRALDAHLTFTHRKEFPLVVCDLDGLEAAGDGSWGHLKIEQPHGCLLKIGPGTGGDLQGLWFARDLVRIPPLTFEDFQVALSGPQRKALARELARRRRTSTLSNGLDVALLHWRRHDAFDVLALTFEGTGDTIRSYALPVAAGDEASLLLRAGPDAIRLRQRRAVVLGAGALGGHVAVLLAESGMGYIRIVDPEVLTPGNVVRHVAGHPAAGMPKIMAVRHTIEQHAPWTKVEDHLDQPLSPQRLRRHLADIDIAVDATGSGSAAGATSHVANQIDVPLVSAALYRGGALARIRRQGFPGDTPILDRTSDPRYPTIPPGPDGEEYTALDLGCSSRVHNAPPISVVRAAALTAQITVDALLGPALFSDETIEVYRPVENSPFTECGIWQPSIRV